METDNARDQEPAGHDRRPANPQRPRPLDLARRQRGVDATLIRAAAVVTGVALLGALCVESRAQGLADQAERNETVQEAPDDPLMEAAKQKGRSTLAQFLALSRAPEPTMTKFAVKVGLKGRRTGLNLSGSDRSSSRIAGTSASCATSRNRSRTSRLATPSPSTKKTSSIGPISTMGK